LAFIPTPFSPQKNGKKKPATHRTLSTLNPFSPAGMTTNAASATSAARMSSEPYCLGARAGLRARARVENVSGVGRIVVDRAICDHVLAEGERGKNEGRRNRKRGRGLR